MKEYTFVLRGEITISANSQTDAEEQFSELQTELNDEHALTLEIAQIE